MSDVDAGCGQGIETLLMPCQGIELHAFELPTGVRQRLRAAIAAELSSRLHAEVDAAIAGGSMKH